ncbi:MAG: T9SS type A sorting domain-containing protein, partial [Chitinophagales bacterium]|nr:T9SS type A sorting domain-containing protein [Chitinophagales bacterium]
TYTATVTDANSCSVSVSGTVTTPVSALSATSVSTDQTQGSTDGAVNVTVSGGTAPYTSLWSNSATSEDLSSLAAGTYSVTITDANGCTFNLADTVGLVTGIATLQNSFGFNLYPNPTQDKLFIELSLGTAGNITVQIYNIEGRLINEFTDKNIVTTRYELNFATQAAGIYLAKIKAGDATVTQRFTVVK